MTEKKLTQEQIDALIRGAGSPAPSKNPSNFKNLGITDEDLSRIKDLFKTSIDASCKTLEDAIGKEVVIEKMSDPELAGQDKVSSLLLSPYMAIKVDYTIGLNGFDLLLIKPEDAYRLARLQLSNMGMDDESMIDPDLEISATSELMNQMMGNSSTALAQKLGIDIDISTPSISEVSNNGTPIPFLKESDDSYIYVLFSIKVKNSAGDTILSIDLMKILDSRFVDDLRRIMDGEDITGENSSDHASNDGNNIDIIDNEDTVAGVELEPIRNENPSQDFNNYNNQGFGQMNNAQPNANTGNPQDMQQYMNMMQQLFQTMQQNPMMNPMMQFNQPIGAEHKVDTANIEAMPFNLKTMGKTFSTDVGNGTIERVREVEVDVVVELGRTKKRIKEILDLTKGSVIELNRLSGEPVDLYVNGTLIARGEIVVMKDNFGFRILEILDSSKII